MKLPNNKKKYSKLKTKKKQKNEGIEFNIGLAILRPILAFFVIITHFYNSYLAKGYWKLIFIKTERLHFHVRIFFIMAFYFSYKTIISNDSKKILNRLERLCIPYFLWPAIIYYLNNKLLIKYKRNIKIITYENLKMQYLFGDIFIPTFWYQWDLILITLLFILIVLIFKSHYNFILIILCIQSFIYQYNGKNYQHFRYKKNGLYTLGRILEMLPCSVIGFNIAFSGILNFLKKHRFKAIIIFAYFSYFLAYYDIFTSKAGFNYNGFKMYFVSILLFIIFALFPSDKIKNKIIIWFIKQITNYTGGVYYLHMPICSYIRPYIKIVESKTIKGCLIIYILCYIFCMIGNLIFGKTKLRNLFL